MAQIGPMRSESKALAAFGPADLQLNRALTAPNRTDRTSHLRMAGQDGSHTHFCSHRPQTHKGKINVRKIFLFSHKARGREEDQPLTHLLGRWACNLVSTYSLASHVSSLKIQHQYIYDYYLSINTSVSIVGVRCPASGLTRQ